MEKIPLQYKSDLIKIVLFGGESTGKTTLAKQLAEYYKTKWVPEFSREYCQKKWNKEQKKCEYSDVIPIAVGQMKSENTLAKQANKILICDTDIFETKIYSEIYYQRVPKELEQAVKINHYDLYLLTYIDMPWIADDVRDKFDEREEIFKIFKKALISENKKFVLLKGDKETRFKRAIEIINSLKQ